MQKKSNSWYKKAFAVLFIWLICSLSFVFPLSHAIAIREATVYGKHKLPSLVKDKSGNDQTTIEMIYDTLDPAVPMRVQDLSLEIQEYSIAMPFANCASSYCNPITNLNYGANPYQCVCKVQWSPQKSVQLTVKHNPTSLGHDLLLMPDDQPPIIHQASIKQVEQGLELHYKVTDTACSQCYDKCAGIKQVVLEDQEGNVKVIAHDEPDCNVENSLTIPYNKEGTRSFFLTVRDKMWDTPLDNTNHAKRQFLATLTTDYTAPTISQSFVFSSDGSIITYMPSQGYVYGTLNFSFQESAPKKIVAGLSALGHTQDIEEPFNNRASNSCFLEDSLTNRYRCLFEDIRIEGRENKAYEFEVTVTDSNNNHKTQKLKKTFLTDNKNPQLLSWSNAYNTQTTDGRIWLKQKNNTLTLTFNEEGAGLDAKQILLDLQELGYFQLVPATECKTVAQQWVCTWLGIENQRQITTPLLRLHPSSTDKILNPVEGILTAAGQYDNQAPEIGTVQVLAYVHGASDLLIPYIKINDAMILKLNATDDRSGIQSVQANFSPFFKNLARFENVSLECAMANNDRNATCMLVTEPIEIDQPSKLTLTITVMDKAGNSVKKSVTVQIYKPNTGDTPDCYALLLKDEYIPPIEKVILESLTNPNNEPINYFLTVPFMLEQAACSKDLHLTNPQLFCEGGAVELTRIHPEQPTYYGTITLALDPRAVLNAGKDTNSITIGSNRSCRLEFYTIYNNYFHTIPENETIAFTIPLTNSILMPDKLLLEDIDRALAEYSSFQKTLKDVDKTITLLSQVCAIQTIFNKIISIFTALNVLFCGLAKIPVIGPGFEAARTTVIVPVTTFFSGFSDTVIKTIVMVPCAITLCKGTFVEITLPGIDGKVAIIPGGVLTIIRNYVGLALSYFNIDTIIDYTYGTLTDQEKKTKSKEARELIKSIPSEYDLAMASPILAGAGLCLPGIIYHARKDTELLCMKALCYAEATFNMLPKYECDQIAEFTKCLMTTNWWSIFAEAFGLTGLLNLVIRVITNPVAAAYVGAKLFLGISCAEVKITDIATCGETSTMCTIYSSLNALEIIVLADDTFKGMWTQITKLGKTDESTLKLPNYCQQLEEKRKTLD
ncbi:MAG: hypothetical protein QW594_03960 [Candidatus Woesearchaeota archaeon]